MNKPTYKAVDIVILPPAEINDLAIASSESLVGAKYIKLNNRHQLPHISLLMGGLREDKIVSFWEKAARIISEYKGIELVINEIRIRAGYTGFHLDKGGALAELHRELYEELSNEMDFNVNLDSVAINDGEVLGKTLKWVNGFAKNSALERFDPHITIGDGKLEDTSHIELPMTFKAERFALAHLGNLCTVNNVLSEV